MPADNGQGHDNLTRGFRGTMADVAALWLLVIWCVQIGNPITGYEEALIPQTNKLTRKKWDKLQQHAPFFRAGLLNQILNSRW